MLFFLRFYNQIQSLLYITNYNNVGVSKLWNFTITLFNGNIIILQWNKFNLHRDIQNWITIILIWDFKLN